ncbi:MAG: 2-oxo acid dehydrogenase subunit E2 [Oscillospiraceae bacterium]|nr:2-oxo acid dehydrogenase subunit E2 [Oscillospiraceae bacterium]
MANTIQMPQIGISEESAVLTQWHIEEGAAVSAGDKLFSIETGKASFDVESEYTGTLLALYAAEGDEVAVGAPVCAIGADGEQLIVDSGQLTVKDEKPVKPASRLPAPPSAPQTINYQLSTVNCPGVSPRARNLAAKLGVDPAWAVPTGPEGRVIERDVRRIKDDSEKSKDRDGGARGTGGVYTEQPLSNMRKIIAKAMTASLQNAAQLTHTASFDATAVLAYRERFKADPQMSGVTLTDIILYAVTRTLPQFPALNAWLSDDILRVFSSVNLAVAVDTERGLMVPVIFGASGKTLPELSAELKTLAEQCRTGSISPDLLTGGSFTVSNLGQFGIESFTPILNAPQTGILGVNCIRQRVRVVDGCIGAYPAMTLSLTYDHRALDGAPASKFLQTLCRALEEFHV